MLSNSLHFYSFTVTFHTSFLFIYNISPSVHFASLIISLNNFCYTFHNHLSCMSHPHPRCHLISHFHLRVKSVATTFTQRTLGRMSNIVSIEHTLIHNICWLATSFMTAIRRGSNDLISFCTFFFFLFCC